MRRNWEFPNAAFFRRLQIDMVIPDRSGGDVFHPLPSSEKEERELEEAAKIKIEEPLIIKKIISKKIDKK